MKKIINIISYPLVQALVMILAVLIAETENSLITFLSLILFFAGASAGIILSVIFKKRDVAIFISLIAIVSTVFAVNIYRINTAYKTLLPEIEQSQELLGVITEYPGANDNRVDFYFKILAVKNPGITDFKKVASFDIVVKVKNGINCEFHKGMEARIRKKISVPRDKIFEFEYKKYLRHKRIYGEVYINTSDLEIIPKKTLLSWHDRFMSETIWLWRDKILSVFKSSMSDQSYGFFSSIFFGSKTELDESVLQEFRDSGLIHLLAISGLHIGFIGAIFFKFFSLFLSKTKSYILSVLFLYLYVLLLPSQPSALRAAFMYSITAFFFVMGNRTLSVTILSFSAIVLLFINPYYIYNLGFQFSYLATLGIILFNKDLGRLLPKFIPGRIKDSLSVTFCAFVSIFLLQWAIFGRVPLFSLITSVVFVPLFELLFSSLFITTIVFLILRTDFIVIIMDKAIRFFLQTVSLAGKVSPVNLPDIPVCLGYISIPAILFILYALFPYIKKKVKYYIIR